MSNDIELAGHGECSNAGGLSLEALRALGISPETVFTAVVEKIVTEVMEQRFTGYDEDDGPYEGSRRSAFHEKVAKHAMERIDAAIDERVAAVVTPWIEQYVAALVLQPSSVWGENKGPTITLTEHITHTATGWLQDKVDSNGLSMEEYRRNKGDSYYHRDGANYTTPRIVWLFNRTITDAVHGDVRAAVADVVQAFGKQFQEAVRKSVADVVSNVKIEVKTAR